MKRYLTETIKLPTRDTRYYHTMLFIGRGAFPIDMLRYDECFPRKEGEPLAYERGDDYEEYRIIKIAKFSAHADPDRIWTFDRWKSFGWLPVFSVVDCSECGKAVDTDYAAFYGQGPKPLWVHSGCNRKPGGKL